MPTKPRKAAVRELETNPVKSTVARHRIHVVTDSAVAFPHTALAARPDVTILPLTIHIGTKSFLEQDGATLETIRPLLSCRHTLPVVASPSVEAYLATFECLARQTRNILCLHTSGQLCRAVRNARTAAESFTGRLNIIVMDSLTTSVGVGFLIGEALRIADQGASPEEVVRQLRYLVPRLYAVFFVEDLAYLQRASRISRAQVLLGEMLGIKPFLSLEEGGLVPLDKAQNHGQAVEKLVDFVSEFTHLRHLAVIYNMKDGAQQGEALLHRVREVFPDCPVSAANLGASVASIFGPHATGLIAFDMPGGRGTPSGQEVTA